MNRKTTILIVGGLLVVAVIALVAAFVGGPDEGSDDVGLAYGEVTVEGGELPILADPASDPAVGMPAPALEGQGFEGEPLAIRPGTRPMVLLFLAHWCPHCQNEVPRMQDWIEETGGPTDVDLYSVSTSVEPTRPNYPPWEWLEREGWTPPVLVDDEQGTAAQAYGLSGFPYWVLVGSDGTVQLRLSGELDRDRIEQLFEVAGQL